MTVAVTGATGFVGSGLVRRLIQDGHRVRALTRDVGKAKQHLPSAGGALEIVGPEGWARAIQGCTGVVNLAGAPISQRWNAQIKEEIKTSRVSVTSQVVDALEAAPEGQRPRVLVSSSAVGYYGTSESKSFDEESPSGGDYLAEVCRDWEAATEKVRNKGVRLVLIRTGIVLDKEGGALAKMVPIFQLFAGGPIGSGRQWFSWIHRDDLVELLYQALTNSSYEGVINGTAPNPVRMKTLCVQLGAAMGRPSWLPVPEAALRLALGDGASVVLDGQRVLPSRAEKLGFKYKYPYVSDALTAIFAK